MSAPKLVVVTGEVMSDMDLTVSAMTDGLRDEGLTVVNAHAGDYFRGVAGAVLDWLRKRDMPPTPQALSDATEYALEQGAALRQEPVTLRTNRMVNGLVSTVSADPRVQLGSDEWWLFQQQRQDILEADLVVHSGQRPDRTLSGSDPVLWLVSQSSRPLHTLNKPTMDWELHIRGRRARDAARDARSYEDPRPIATYDPAIPERGIVEVMREARRITPSLRRRGPIGYDPYAEPSRAAAREHMANLVLYALENEA